jgi:hypothetical protein
MRTSVLVRGLAVAGALVVAAVAVGMAQPEAANLPFGQEVTIVFKRDDVGVKQLMPRHGGDAANTNLVGEIVGESDAWLRVRVGQFVANSSKLVFDDVWVARDSILLIVRTN